MSQEHWQIHARLSISWEAHGTLHTLTRAFQKVWGKGKCEILRWGLGALGLATALWKAYTQVESNECVMCIHCAVLCLVAQTCLTLCDPMDCSPPGSSVHGDYPGKNTRVGCHALLQGIFLTQGLNPGLLHCRSILYCLSHQGSPRILEWVAHPFSRGSSWPRNWTGVSCISGRFFTSWATREVQCIHYYVYFEFTLGIRNSLFSVLFP